MPAQLTPIYIICNFNNRLYNKRPEIELLTLDINSQIKNEDYIKSLRKCYGINVVPEAFFNISRDLKVCFPEFPLFPFAGQWNSWNPFVDCDHVEIQDLSELKELKVTLKGEPIEHKKSPDAELL